MNTPSYFCHTGIFSHPLICHEPALFLLPRWDFLQYLPSTIPKGCVFFFKEKSQRFDLLCCVLRQFQKSILVQEKSQSVDDVRSPPGGKTHHQQRTDVRYNSHCSTLLLLCICVNVRQIIPFFFTAQRKWPLIERTRQILFKTTAIFVNGSTIHGLNEGCNKISWYAKICQAFNFLKFPDMWRFVKDSISLYFLTCEDLSRIQSSSTLQWSCCAGCNYIPLPLKQPSTGSMGSRKNLHQWQIKYSFFETNICTSIIFF